MSSKKKTLLVALGGNAMIRKGQEGTVDQQFENLAVPVGQLARLSRRYRLVITHGNGPQVGNLLLQQECCPQVPRLPLEILVAQTQGQIGYMIESTLDTQLMRMGIKTSQKFITVISYVVVDEKDPAFAKPTKPIGPLFTAEQAAKLPYPTQKKTAKGYRRLVVSPLPITIVQKREIRELIHSDFVVICCGGGGIPVVRDGRHFAGVDAVIDKDLASAKLAHEVGVDIFIIATDVHGAALNFGTDRETYLSDVTLDEARQHLADHQFAEGAMAPKVTACIHALEGGVEKAAIVHLTEIEKAVEGHAGTRFRV